MENLERNEEMAGLPRIQVGDRVMWVRPGKERGWIDGYEGLEISEGETGTVCDIKNFGCPTIGVNWDKAGIRRHTCQWRCADNHGWYVYEDELIRMDDCQEDEALFADLENIL